jgi:RHS repeat-associated protein
VLRTVNATSGQISYEREYTLKDHLGNLRLAYRLGQVRTYTATLNLADADQHRREAQQFDSLSVSAPIATATPRARSDGYAAQLNAGGAAPQPLGPLKQLAVQQGDTVTVTAPGLYPQATEHTFWFSLASFLTGLLQPAPNLPAPPDAVRRGGLPLLQVGVAAGLAAVPQLSGGVPKGYVRLLVFDADSNLVSQQTQQLSAAALNNYESLRLQVVVPQDGYVSAYVGNESNVDVYFDDVTVEHRPGLQVQETQYDPTGLELAGLAGTTPGLKPLNQYKFNGKEFQADLGLNWNHQDWRFFDPQLLRWHVVDPELENGQESWTPYSFGFDNAVRYADADGRAPGDGVQTGTIAGLLYNTGVGLVVSAINTVMFAGESTSPASAGLQYRASQNADGGISFGMRMPATSGQEVIGNLATDLLDVANVGVTVASGGGAGFAGRGLAQGAGMLLAKTGGAGVVTNSVVQQGKKVATAAYEVDSFNKLRNRSLPGDGLELHHAVQQKPAKSLVPGYKGEGGPAIALPKAEHRRIPTLRGNANAGSPRNQLAKDIRDLRNYTFAPNESLQKLIELNKTTYPGTFVK